MGDDIVCWRGGGGCCRTVYPCSGAVTMLGRTRVSLDGECYKYVCVYDSMRNVMCRQEGKLEKVVRVEECGGYR